MTQQSDLGIDCDAFSALMGTFNQMLKKYSEKTDLSQILPNLKRITPDSVLTLKKSQGLEDESESVSKVFVCPYFLRERPEFPAAVVNTNINFEEFSEVLNKSAKDKNSTERNKTILEAMKKVDISVSNLGKQTSILYEEHETTKRLSNLNNIVFVEANTELVKKVDELQLELDYQKKSSILQSLSTKLVLKFKKTYQSYIQVIEDQIGPACPPFTLIRSYQNKAGIPCAIVEFRDRHDKKEFLQIFKKCSKKILSIDFITPDHLK